MNLVAALFGVVIGFGAGALVSALVLFAPLSREHTRLENAVADAGRDDLLGPPL